MEKRNIVRLMNKQQRGFWVSLLTICFLAVSIVAQVRDTDYKANQNLKSSARVNPATLAMEFSIPLGGYPGRAGNSTPLSLNYSSKVWTMKQWDFARRDDGGEGTQAHPFLVTTFSSSKAEYGERTHSGWTSSLQPLSFISEYEFYGGGGIQGENTPESDNSCKFIEDHWEYDSECPDGKHVYVYECPQEEQLTNTRVEIIFCQNFGIHEFPGPEPYPNGAPPPGVPASMVKRARLVMPDGSTKEFRKDDKIHNCYTNYEDCNDRDGKYLSTDGSGAILAVNEDQGSNIKKNVLYMPDGGRYVFNNDSQEFTDRNGNKTVYDVNEKKWTDSMGREIVLPLPEAPPNGTGPQVRSTSYALPALEGESRSVTQKWQRLVPEGCVNGYEPICAEVSLENPTDALYNLGTDTCQTRDQSNPVSPSLFTADPDDTQQVITQTSPQRWTDIANKYRVCGGLFNPVVLRELVLSDGSKYQFKYNRYGEITKIIYPTGAYERFRYGVIASTGASLEFPYSQANRGVVEHWISEDGVDITQHWEYDLQINPVQGQPGNLSTTFAPDGSKIERIFSVSNGSPFGFEDPLSGKLVEEKIYSKKSNPNDENSRTLLRRNLTDWKVEPARTGGYAGATRDPRVSQNVSIIFENGQALATLSKTEYDEDGSADPEYFSHLNVKQSKGYHYKVVSNLETAKTGSLATIAALFSESDLASFTETEYSYSANYKARGIIGLPIRTKVLNPSNPDPNNPLAKTETVYDNTIPVPLSNYNYPIHDYQIGTSLDCSTDALNPKICWQNPGSALRGNPTTSRVWNKDSNTWIETHTQYDQFGNAVKAKDLVGNEAETQFNSQYKYAYPIKSIAPAPGDGINGTNLTSQTETTYDFNTGLPIKVKDDFGQEIETEYDVMLRPERVKPVAPLVAPITETIYGEPGADGQFSEDERFVKVRKQIDATNWDEATTWFDGLGRTKKTKAKDSQGDVFTETKYDLMGRVEKVTNPYRQGNTVYWNKTRYDDLGRAVESYAPAQDGQAGASLGITSFSISTQGLVGTVVTSTDASNRRGRSITNALGQLLRVDEPTKETTDDTNETTDLGDLTSPKFPTFYTYDVYGKMVKVQQGKPGDATIQYRYFKYDSLGRLIKIRQPEQEVNSALNTTGNPDNNQWTAAFAYDILGNVKRATDANGVNIVSEYDKASRVTKRCFSKPNITTTATECGQLGGNASTDTPTVEYWYDAAELGQAVPSPNYANGKLTKVYSSVSETRYTQFDNFGRLKESQQKTPFGNQSVADATARISKYTYNFSGALSEQEYPSKRVVKHEFEPDGDLSKIHGKAQPNAMDRTYASGFTYTPDGRIEKLQLGNGLWESAKFDPARGQVTELALGTTAGDGSLWKLEYKYGELAANGVDVDANKNTGNIAKQTLSFNGLAQPLVQTYRYDSLYRLKEARETSGTQTTSPQTWKQTFDYDRFGNRTSYQKFVGTSQITLDSISTPSVNAQMNRLTVPGYTYDKNGNVIIDAEGRSFTFNGDNKQIEVKNASNVLLGKYFYDGEGKRVKKKTYDPYGVEQDETVFVYDGMGKLVAEYSTAPPPANPTTSFTATDQLGSPRVITNSLGEVTSRRDFQPFGEELQPDATYRKATDKYGAADLVRQRFTGYQKDEETGLDFAEARMYENRQARFTAVDPLLASGKSANPQTFNRYVYVMNNPLASTDPTGLQAGCDPKVFGSCQVSTDGGGGFKWDSGTFSLQPILPSPYEENNLLQFSRNTQLANFANLRTQETPPLYLCCVGTLALPNPAAIMDRWEGTKTGTYNFLVGIPNAPLEIPSFFGAGPSLKDMGVPLFFDYAEYGNDTQRMAGFETQVLLTGASFLAGGEGSAGRSAIPNGQFYSVGFETTLDVSSLGKSRSIHFNRANAALDNALNASPSFASSMEGLIPGVRNSVSSTGGRKTPTGWVWHHSSERTGLMQLVPKSQHPSVPGGLFWNTLHPNGRGGYSTWAIPAGAPPN